MKSIFWNITQWLGADFDKTHFFQRRPVAFVVESWSMATWASSNHIGIGKACSTEWPATHYYRVCLYLLEGAPKLGKASSKWKVSSMFSLDCWLCHCQPCDLKPTWKCFIQMQSCLSGWYQSHLELRTTKDKDFNRTPQTQCANLLVADWKVNSW